MKYRGFRDRPLTCRGGYGFLFRSDFFFRTTRELEYLFCLSRKAQFFLPEFNIRLYDKNSESDYLFFLHQNQNIFFSNIGNQNIFLEKTITPSLRNAIINKLDSLMIKDHKQYWKLVNDLKAEKADPASSPVDPDTWKKHFQTLHSVVDEKIENRLRNLELLLSEKEKNILYF